MKKTMVLLCGLFFATRLVAKPVHVKVFSHTNTMTTSQSTTANRESTYTIVPSLSIDQAVAYAMKRKKSIQALHHNIESFKQQRKSARSEFFPKLALTKRYLGLHHRGATCVRETLAFSANQTLFDLVQQAGYKLATVRLSSAHHQKALEKDDVQLETESEFLSGWLSQQKSELILLIYKEAKETLAKAKNQFENNLLKKNDWLSAQADYAEKLATVASYRDELKTAQKVLEYYVGLPIVLAPP